MKEVVYTAYRCDEQALKILGAIAFFNSIAPFMTGEGIQDVMLREERVKEKKARLVLLFSSEGTYPSKHFRIMTPKDFENERFVLPAWVPDLNAVPLDELMRVAVRPRIAIDDEIVSGPLDVAIRNLHYDVRDMKRPQGIRASSSPRIKPRAEWSSGHHAKVRERLSARFGSEHPA